MGMKYQSIVEQALKDRAPSLFRDLKRRGELDGYVVDLADQISLAVLDQIAAARREQRMDDLPPMELVQGRNNAQAQAEEGVLAVFLEFPGDDG